MGFFLRNDLVYCGGLSIDRTFSEGSSKFIAQDYDAKGLFGNYFHLFSKRGQNDRFACINKTVQTAQPPDPL